MKTANNRVISMNFRAIGGNPEDPEKRLFYAEVWTAALAEAQRSSCQCHYSAQFFTKTRWVHLN